MNDKDLIDLIANHITEDAAVFNEAEEHDTDRKFVIKTSRSSAPIWRERRKVINQLIALEPYAHRFDHPAYANHPERQLMINHSALDNRGGYFTKDQYLQLVQSLRQELSAIEQRGQTPIAQQTVMTIYADHCRYAKSPLSGNRYLIVGIDRIAKNESYATYRSQRDIDKHWTLKLRDFYYWAYVKDYMGQPTNVQTRKRFNTILTIKAENILSVQKLYEDEE